MTKKNFVALAEYLIDREGYCQPFTPEQIDHLANFCHAQNPNFDRDRWIAFIKGEVGKNGGKVKV